MQSMSVLRELNSKQFTQRKAGLAAFVVALALHSLFLLLDVSFEPASQPSQSRFSVKIHKQESKQAETPELKEESKTDQPNTNTTSSPEKPLSRTQPTHNKNSVELLLDSKVLTDKKKNSDPELSVPSINGDDFQTFLQRETERALSQNKEGEDEFLSTFSPPDTRILKDTKRETGPLGGGNYKVVRNGVECEILVQVPQTLSEITGEVPLLSGAGNCRDLNNKIDLLDKRGQVKNSDRHDWN